MNINLWFARDIHTDEIVSILDAKQENKYCCPICNSEAIPKALESKKVTPHFAHLDRSKCSSEAMIHWWYKHRFIEVGDTFTIKTDKEIQFTCKSFEVEKEYALSNGTYKPDLVVYTECGHEIVFEMANTNKKKVEDYIDQWIELGKIIVEVDIKSMVNDYKVFNALYYQGKCFNFNKRDGGYYNTIGKLKEKMLSEGNYNIEKIRQLDWFWREIGNYNNGKSNINKITRLIDNVILIDGDLIKRIFNKKQCSSLYQDYKQFHRLEYFKEMELYIKELNEKYDEAFMVEIDKKYVHKRITIKRDVDGKYENIGSKSGGEYLSTTLEEDFSYINEVIRREILNDKMVELKNNILNNNSLLEAIDLINNKYKSYAIHYSLELNSNERYNTGKPHHVYLTLYYHKNKILELDITNDNVFKSNSTDEIFNYIDLKISKYRDNIVKFKDIAFITDLLIGLENKYSNIKNKLPYVFYNYNKRSHDIFKWCFGNEGIVKITIYPPVDEYGISDWCSITINNNTVSYWKRKEDGFDDYSYEFTNENDISLLLEKSIRDILDNQLQFKCVDCKDLYNLNISEIEFYIDKNFSLPKRCKTCRQKRKHSK